MSVAEDSPSAAHAPKKAYSWQVPGKNVTVSIDFDVVDRLNKEVQRVQRAGASSTVEVGGILLGTLDSSSGLAATVEDFEPVPCQYSEGPEFMASDADEEGLSDALNRWRRRQSEHLRPVGLYRTNCRTELQLSSRDKVLMHHYFAGGEGIALVIAPRAMKPPQAALFFAEDGKFLSDYSYREFPLRRQELGGGKLEDVLEAPVTGHSTTEGSSDSIGGNSIFGMYPDAGDEEGRKRPLAGTDTTAVPARTLRLRGGWVWLPLSFVFLLVGTVLGFQVALSVRSKVVDTPTVNPYEMQLSATPSAESVHLRWDRNSPAVQNAERGRLIINEDGQTKNVDLDAGHLRNGSVIYRQAGNEISFRLELFLDDQVRVSQTVEYNPVTASAGAQDDG